MYKRILIIFLTLPIIFIQFSIILFYPLAWVITGISFSDYDWRTYKMFLKKICDYLSE